MGNFLKWTAASAIGTLVGLTLFVGLLGLGAIGLAAALLATTTQESEPTVEDNSILVLDLATDIRDSLPPGGPGVILGGGSLRRGGRSLSIYQALSAINRAAEDDRIVGLFIYGNTPAGFATLSELRTAIATFQDQGKPVIAYEVGWSERDYYLTSVADTVILDESGLLEFNGFQAETQFWAGALEQYGVGVQVLQAGRFKSAVEPFTRTSSSDEDRTQMESLLGGIWREFLGTVADSREPSSADLQQLADGGGLLRPAQAQGANLVDQVASYDDVLATLQTLTEVDESVGEDLPAIDLVSYSNTVSRSPGRKDGVIAVLYAEGNIVLGEGGTGVIGSDTLGRNLRELRLDDDVEAVVLRINSPGGSATASEILADAVTRLQAEKPVIISMGNVAASGGYMMAAAGQRIYASPNTITGSIGVFGLLVNFQDVANRNGITWDVVKTAPFADIGTIARPQNPQEMALQQGLVNDLYDRFLDQVATGRDLTRARVESVAQGRVWTGEDAIQADLVDELGGLETAIAAAAEAAELTTWEVAEYPYPRTLGDELWEWFFADFTSRFLARAPQHPLLTELRRAEAQWLLLESLNDPQGAYTRLPLTLEFK